MSSPNDSFQYSFSYADAVNVLRLIRESATVSSFEFELGDIKLSVVREHARAAQATPAAQAPSPVPSAPAGPASQRAAAPANDSPATVNGKAAYAGAGEITVAAPMLGIFYRSPSPGADPFVREGDIVQAGDVIGLIEVMKLFTQVTAHCAGRVVRFDAQDNALVEHGESLMVIERLSDA